MQQARIRPPIKTGLACPLQEVDPQAAIDTVRAAYEAGINLFDTSPYYGLTKSEEVGVGVLWVCRGCV